MASQTEYKFSEKKLFLTMVPMTFKYYLIQNHFDYT